MGEHFHLDIGRHSDVGRIREVNEDSLGAFEQLKESLELSTDLVARKGKLYAVADGMGGHAAGEVASKRAIHVLFQHYYEDTDLDLSRSLEQAFWVANAEIYAQAATNSDQSGMGTTLVAAVVQEDQVIIANVGDSRAYLIQNGQPAQISRDHSWVNEQVEAGLLTETEAQTHIYRNIITRSMGSRPYVEVDTFNITLQVGDAVVLCTDGISNDVNLVEIGQVVTEADNVNDAASALIDLANRRSGSDNLTAIVIKIVGTASPKSSLPWVVAGALSALLLFGLAGLCLSGSPLVHMAIQHSFPKVSGPASTHAPDISVGYPLTIKPSPKAIPSSIVPSPSPSAVQTQDQAPTESPAVTAPSGTTRAPFVISVPPTSTGALHTPSLTIPSAVTQPEVKLLAPATLPIFGWRILRPTLPR